MLRTTLTTAGLLLATASSALANAGGCAITNTCPVVPEISALEGTAALAAVVAIVALVWERRRRAA